MDYLVGVDCGATKTHAIVYDINSNKLNESFSCASNFSLKSEEAMNVVVDSIENAIKGLKGNCLMIAVGASGLRGSGLASIIKEKLSKIFKTNVVAVDDGQFSMKASLNNKDGILVISGTGSVVYGQKNGIVRSRGGWGHLLGERGSSYSVAISALYKMVNSFDLGNNPSVLDERLLSAMNISSPLRVPAFVYSAEKACIASLSSIINDEADKGNEIAVQIIKEEADALASSAISLVEDLEINSPIVITVGSLIKNSSVFHESFFELFRKKEISISLSECCDEPQRAVFAYYEESRK